MQLSQPAAKCMQVCNTSTCTVIVTSSNSIGVPPETVHTHGLVEKTIITIRQERIKGKSLQLRPFRRRAEFASATKNRLGFARN